MTIYGNFVHFVGLAMKKQKSRPKRRESPSQRPTKVLSPHGQAQLEVLAKTAHVHKLAQLENSLQFCIPLEITPRRTQALKPN